MPLFVDLDVVVLHLLPCRTHSLLISVLQDVFAVLRMNSIQDVEKVLLVAVLSFWKRVRHKLHELRILFDFIPKVCH